jgi:hypothetical protein
MIDWQAKYMREVEGLNNEGDPIGGDSPSGLRHELQTAKARIKYLESELNEWNEFKKIRDSQMAQLRKQFS